MMPEGDFYLAHPKGSRHFIRKWELEFEERTGIQLINPFYDVHRPEILAEDAGLTTISPNSIKIVESDLELVEIAKRGIVAIIDGAPSIGTFQEMVYSNQIFKKPETYSIVTDGRQDHHWVKFHSNKIFLNYDEFEKFITK